MKVKIFIIISIIFLALLGLYLVHSHRYIQDKNAFERKIANPKLEFINSSELPERYYFAGTPETKIFLTYPKDMRNLYKLDTSFKKLDTIRIDYPINFNVKAINIYKYAYMSYIFSTNSYGDILRSEGNIQTLYKYQQFRFDHSQVLSKNSMVIRVKHTDNKSLAKITLLKQASMTKEFIFPKLNYGSIANDGLLLYNTHQNKIIYLYYYRGEFLSLDTNLNLLNKVKTIDTIQSANIRTKIIQHRDVRTGKSSQIVTQATPPKFINSFATTFKNRIYIISKLKADNEEDSDFAKNQIIDVYNLLDGSYIYSFYVPKYMGKRVRQFYIKENLLIALNGKYIVKYKFAE